MKETEKCLLLWLLLNRQDVSRAIINDQREMSYLRQLSLYKGRTKKILFW